MNAKIVSLEDHPAHSSTINRVKAEKIFNALTSHTVKYSHALMQGMFDSADDTLFDMAEKAENNSDQAIYFDSMRIIRLKRKDIESSFCQQIENLFTNYIAASSSHLSVNHNDDAHTQSDFSCSNLSLMDDFDLEESLAINTLSEKIRSHYTAEIRAIEKRLAHLKPEVVTDQKTNPFDAKNICSAFQQATHDLETEIKIKLIVFKLFDQHISKSIGQLYQEINVRFIEAGILPKIKITTEKISSHAALSRQEPHSTKSHSIENAIIEQNHLVQNTSFPGNQNEILIPLQQILAQAHFTANSDMNFTGNINAGSGAATTMTTGTSEQVVTALNQLQQQSYGQTADEIYSATSLSQTANPQEISSHIKSILHAQISQSTGQSVSINAIDNGVIDIVSMLFEFILDDDNLPATAKAEIARLQIPLIKVAIIDKELFNTKGHPARVLLNTLAKAGLGLDEYSTTENNAVLAKITSTVEQILDNFQNDLDIFSTLLNELNHFITDVNQRGESSQNIVIKAFEKKEEVSLAQAWVNETLEETLMGKSLPDQIEKIIKGPWAKVMQHTYLEQGKDCILWKNQLRFIDVLAWSIEPKHISLDRKKLGNIVKHLISTLREGLSKINYPKDKLDKLFNALEAFHLSSLHGIDATKIADKPASNSSTQSQHSFFLFENVDSQTDVLELDTNSESGFLFPVTEQQDSIHTEITHMPNLIEQAINEMEHQVASLSELETMLEDVLEDPEEFSSNRIILDDIVLTGWEEAERPEDHPQDEYLDLARHLDAGKWVEFVNEIGKTQRAKLAWKSDLLGEYTFLNWKFDVVADKTLFGLAADLRTGRAKVINDVPILDRALGAVLSRFNQKTA